MPPNTNLARRLVNTLPAQAPGLFNPWVESCVHQTPSNGPRARIARLAQHLDCAPLVILVGEAPGYQGCRYSGVAFTSERLLLAGEIPRIPAPGARLISRRIAFSEPSATIVWKALNELGIAEKTLLWNALQLHPFRAHSVWSNRPPTPAEVQLGKPALTILAAAFPNAKIVAVGTKARDLLAAMGIPVHGCVRHPTNGGATEFRRGLKALISSLSDAHP